MNLYTGLKIFIRLLPSGHEAELELPDNATGNMIVQSVINDPDFKASKIDVTTKKEYSWSIRSMKTGLNISLEKTLSEVGISNGDTLIISPDLVAGGFSGNLIYELPNKFTVGKKGKCKIRIAKKSLAELALSHGIKSDQVKEIEINNIMIVRLEENATNNHFYINSLNSIVR